MAGRTFPCLHDSATVPWSRNVGKPWARNVTRPSEPFAASLLRAVPPQSGKGNAPCRPRKGSASDATSCVEAEPTPLQVSLHGATTGSRGQGGKSLLFHGVICPAGLSTRVSDTTRGLPQGAGVVWGRGMVQAKSKRAASLPAHDPQYESHRDRACVLPKTPPSRRTILGRDTPPSCRNRRRMLRMASARTPFRSPASSPRGTSVGFTSPIYGRHSPNWSRRPQSRELLILHEGKHYIPGPFKTGQWHFRGRCAADLAAPAPEQLLRRQLFSYCTLQLRS